MPFNPAQFVFQPRPLQSFDIGAGFRDLAETRMNNRRLAENKRQAEASIAEQQAARGDLNTRFSAELASTQTDAQRQEVMKRYQEAVGLVDKARGAVAAGDWNGADAMSGRITELGGTVDKQTGAEGRPVYSFKAPQQPGRVRPDYQGTRSEIFGGGGGPTMGQPFSMPSPSGPPPGMFSEQNPFDSLPGASAEAANPPGMRLQAPEAPSMAAPPAAAPPPAGAPPSPAGAASPPQSAPAPDGSDPQTQAMLGQIGEQLDGSAAGAPGAQPPGAPAPPVTEKNPFDPFKLDTNQLIKQNELRLNPYFEGAKGAIPLRFQDRVQSLNQGASALGLPPEETLKLWQPTLNTAAGLMKGEMSAEAAASRTALSGENAELGRNIRLENRTFSRADKIASNTGLKTAIEKLQVANGADAYLNAAVRGNGQAATQLTAQLFRMNQSGVMTDKDFEHASHGAVTIWQAIKDGTIQTLFKNGLTHDQYDSIKEVLDLSRKNHIQSISNAQNQLWTQVVRAGSEEERKSAEDAIMQLIPQEYWSPEIKEAFGVEVPQKSGNVDQSGNYATNPRPRAAPATPASKVSASKSGRVSKSKPVEKMTDGEVSKELEELMK